MLSTFERDRNLILIILDYIQKIERFSSDHTTFENFFEDIKSFDASVMNLMNIGECVSKVSEAMKQKYSFIAWKKIKAFRNYIAHNYEGLNPKEIWQIIQFNLPQFKTELNNILNDNK
ncbi:MAG: DUF86 domain-containing protein [Chitinophagales bacterium]|nr:DUF86 domain-containing protein [Chitinophagales bacterium]